VKHRNSETPNYRTTEINDLSRCAIHTMTHKPWTLAECCDHFARIGLGGVSIWRDVVDLEQRGVGLAEAVRIVKDSGLTVPAYVRGGFFPDAEPALRQQAVDLNRTILDEAAALGAEQVVLVVGAVPGLPLAEARQQVAAGIAKCLPHAESVGVKLSIEPLHPMYAADKSCVNRMAEARAICEQLEHPLLGIAVDVYHVWWDPNLADEIQLAGQQQRLFGFHVCDWRVETNHLLTDRGLMGEGCIDVHSIRGLMEQTGFHGYHEVEIFSQKYWNQDQAEYLQQITEAYLENV
jgi:sugar phosphate isomerase/epimerase